MKYDILIKRIDPELPLPLKATADSLGIDLYARYNVHFSQGDFIKVPLNVVVKPPDGYGSILTGRSSLFGKHGVIVTNGIGVIDSDYCGENDEILLPLYKLTPGNTTIAKGERIAQLILIPRLSPDYNFFNVREALTIDSTNRGGFGSSGH